LRQIEFARAAFASGTPIFGICWGLQLATVAMGGEVTPIQATDCACEAPFATGIRLSKAGRAHPMHLSRREVFDSFAFHFDEVTRLPENATMTASNRNFIQAAEIRGGKSIFWGVQYHPEMAGPDMANFLRGCGRELVAGGRYRDRSEVEEAARAVSQFDLAGSIAEQDRRHFDEIDVGRFEFQPIEIANWIKRLVIPSMQTK
jgi:GMP synthase (glutamine-hydrolysing)